MQIQLMISRHLRLSLGGSDSDFDCNVANPRFLFGSKGAGHASPRKYSTVAMMPMPAKALSSQTTSQSQSRP